jgi:hypothetical protein
MAKILFVSVILAVGLFQILSAYDLILGSVGPGNVMVYNRNHQKKGINNQVVNETVWYNGLYNITSIRAIDNFPNKTSVVRQLNGGIGWKNVTLQLMAGSRGWGYNYTIVIHGKK